LTFKPGQSGNPKGRRPKEREIEYTKIIQSKCTPGQWEKIVAKAVEQAIRGDEKARKWLSDNLIGLPVQKQEITGKDGNSIKVRLTGNDG
jgi:hypothetical protein